MPSKSTKHQQLMGMAYAVKTGKKKLSEIEDEDFRKKVQGLVDGMTTKELKDFASTKHEDMKEFKLHSFKEFVNEFQQENATLNPGMTVPGMGSISFPDQPDIPLASQEPGSGDTPTYIPPKETKCRKKKKKKKKKRSEL
jgi:hypothetical protein